jgi:hypothetical protein
LLGLTLIIIAITQKIPQWSMCVFCSISLFRILVAAAGAQLYMK